MELVRGVPITEFCDELEEMDLLAAEAADLPFDKNDVSGRS